MNAAINLNLLRAFQVVAEAQSFAVAARTLGVRRSSVSRSIASLEASLGIQLFSRTTRQVALTTAGSELYSKIKPQLHALAITLGSLPERDEQPSGELRLTATVDFGAHVLARVVSSFNSRYPRVRVDVRLSNGVVDLVAGGFDAGVRIAATRRADSSVVARKLGNLEMHLYGSPSYLARAGIPRTLEDLADHRWLAFRGLTTPLDPAPPRPRITSDDMLFILGSLVAGAGLAFLPSFVAESDLAAGRLLRVLPRISHPVGKLYFVTPPAQHLPRKVTSFRDHLMEYLAAHPLSAA